MKNLLIEFVSTVIFTFMVFATGGNYLMVGAVLSIIIYYSKGIALVNPILALAKYVNHNLPLIVTTKIIIVEIIGALIGVYLYKTIYNR